MEIWGLVMNRTKRKNTSAQKGVAFQPWSAEEIAYLISHHTQMTKREIAIRLGRGLGAIEHKLSQLRELGDAPRGKGKKKARPVSTAQMIAVRDAVESESIFLIDYGVYPETYKWRVKQGLKKALRTEDDAWFWARREWRLQRWLDYFYGVQA